MDSKLTLSVDKQLTEKAKLYAKSQGRSLSDLVESYFKVLTSDEFEKVIDVSPRIKALRGVLKTDEDYNYKEELSKALSKKYMR